MEKLLPLLYRHNTVTLPYTHRASYCLLLIFFLPANEICHGNKQSDVFNTESKAHYSLLIILPFEVNMRPTNEAPGAEDLTYMLELL